MASSNQVDKNNFIYRHHQYQDMETINSIHNQQGETTDVNDWLSRAGLSFKDLGNDASSTAIRKQWREYQTAVRMLCIAMHQPPERVQLSGVYAKLRVPQKDVFTGKLSDYYKTKTNCLP